MNYKLNRIINYNGELLHIQVILDEADYQSQLNRFDLDKITTSSNGYKIDIPCICDSYKECKGCPYNAWAESITTYYVVGCMAIANTFCPPKDILTRYNIRWNKEDDAEARQFISDVRDWLLGAKAIMVEPKPEPVRGDVMKQYEYTVINTSLGNITVTLQLLNEHGRFGWAVVATLPNHLLLQRERIETD